MQEKVVPLRLHTSKTALEGGLALKSTLVGLGPAVALVT